MYLDASFCRFDESVGTLYCTLPWSGQKSRLHSWTAGCQFEIMDKGMTMRHCVGGYAEAVCSGGTYIYRILEPERATLEIRLNSSGIWTVAQIKSFANKLVEHQTRNISLSWSREVQKESYSYNTIHKKEQQHGQKMES